MLEILWTPAALWSLRAMPLRDAARVDAAVLHYARTGQGELTRVYAGDPRALRLRVHPYTIRLFLDPQSGVLTVCWVYRQRAE